MDAPQQVEVAQDDGALGGDAEAQAAELRGPLEEAARHLDSASPGW